MRALLGISAGLSLVAGPVVAQSPEVEQDAERYARDERYDKLDPQPPQRQPWTLALWLPANLRANRRFAERGWKAGVALEPELSLARSWGTGPVTLFTEAGLFASTMLPEPGLDSSGWWLSAELSAGDPAQRWAPYLAYDPRAIHDGLFGERRIRLQDLTLGARRRWGGTAIDLFVRRNDADRAISDRNMIAAHVSHTRALSEKLRLNIRADTEARRFDRTEAGRRVDIRARVRTRLFVALDPSVDLVLTADVQRNRSNFRGRSFTNVVVGPALSARAGF